MSSAEGFLTAYDGTQLHWDSFPATAPQRGVILNICGLGDHSGLHPTITGSSPSENQVLERALRGLERLFQ